MPAPTLDYTTLPPARTPRRDAPLLALILLVATALRGYHLGDRNLWIDELQTALSASGTGLTALHALPRNQLLSPPPRLIGPDAAPTLATLRPDRDDIHPPTYAFLQRCWLNCFGWTEFSFRALAALCSVVGVFCLWGAVRELSGPDAALWAAALAAVAQAHVEAGREARAYALLLTLATAACWAAARIAARGPSRRRTLTLFALCLGLPLVNYFGAFAVLALVAYAATGLHGPQRRAVGLAAFAALALFALAWSPVLWMQAHGASRAGTAFFQDDASGPHWLNTCWRLGLLPQRYFNDPLPRTRPVTLFVWIAPLIALALGRRRRPDLWLWALWIPLNVIPSLALDLAKDAWSLGQLRYTLLASIAMYALVPALVARQQNLIRHGLPALALVGCLLALGPNVFDVKATDNRALGQAVRTLARPGDVTVLACQAYPEGMPLRYLMALAYYARPLPGPLVLTDRPLGDAPLKAQLDAAPAILTVTDGIPIENFADRPHDPGAIRYIPGLGQVERATPR